MVYNPGDIDEIAIPLGDQVTYTEASTPICDLSSPRYVSVKGNEIITITGSGFSTDKNDYEVYLDGVPCVV